MSSHHIKRPLTFLSLAPVHSDSYPKTPASPTAKSPVEAPVAVEKIEKPTDTIITAPVSATARRHSSTSSVGSHRFLRLGPIHGNGDSDDFAIEE